MPDRGLPRGMVTKKWTPHDGPVALKVGEIVETGRSQGLDSWVAIRPKAAVRLLGDAMTACADPDAPKWTRRQNDVFAMARRPSRRLA
jgi:hypothetical protein